MACNMIHTVSLSITRCCGLPQMLASTAVDEPEMQLYAASWRVQFTVNLQRCMLAQLRNPCDAAMRLIVSMWVGLIIGAAFRIEPPNPEILRCGHVPARVHVGGPHQRCGLPSFRCLWIQGSGISLYPVA